MRRLGTSELRRRRIVIAAEVGGFAGYVIVLLAVALKLLAAGTLGGELGVGACRDSGAWR